MPTLPAVRATPAADADLPRLLGTSAAIASLRRRIRHVAATPLPILLTGDTGTGKEAAARSLHELSGRAGPFVAVDCAALSPTLVETELFGHERGAFTGAHHRRDGLVDAARGGTFFLDEVGELPLDTQTRLLRLLEEGTYRPVGDREERRADIRVVAATWRDLRHRVAEGSFRADLYHRLATVELELPPMRERIEDIDLLFEVFLAEAAAESGRAVPDLAPAVRVHLRRWPWPGNVRELRNVAAFVAAMTQSADVQMSDLPPALLRPPPEIPDSGRFVFPASEIRIDLPYMDARRTFLDDFQQRYVEAILAAHDGNVSAAARAAGMDRRSIQRIVRRGRGPRVLG